MKKFAILQNRPNIVGFSILDLARVHVYDFYYGFVKKHYSLNEHNLIYTDTDSLILALYDRDIHEIMREFPEFFDTSKYLQDNKFGIVPQNANITGLWKIECPEDMMTHWVGLRVKLYSYLLEGGGQKIAAKGVKKSVINNQLTFKNFLDCLLEKTKIYREQVSIRSLLHKVFTVRTRKLAISWEEDKRLILENNINTVPWGFLPREIEETYK